MKREYHYTNRLLKNRRRQLRSQPTPSEIVIWNYLKQRKLGIKFTRQYSIDGYIVDFYCQEKRYALEIEGEIHKNPTQMVYDKYRYRYISSHDIKILIISNYDVKNNIASVLQKIINNIPS